MARRIQRKPGKIVQFDFEDRTYQIDPDLKKVYRAFVEIETAKASEILMNWRADAVAASV
jgi:hypothetical protein